MIDLKSSNGRVGKLWSARWYFGAIQQWRQARLQPSVR